jgi:hypothetical protein
MSPGKSVVFAALEVCLCALLRQIPSLNPQAPATGFHSHGIFAGRGSMYQVRGRTSSGDGDVVRGLNEPSIQALILWGFGLYFSYLRFVL